MHPPPDPPKKNQAAYGSRTGIADKVEARTYKTIDAFIAMQFFEKGGYPFSADLLKFYLSNPGPNSDFTIKSEFFQKTVNTEDVKGVVSRCLDSIIDQARADPQVGVVRELTSNWIGAGPTENQDVEFGIGHFDVSVGSDTIVRSAEDGLHAEVSYKVYVWDYYNFEAKNWIPFGNVKRNTANEIGAHMRELEEFGWARSYVARGQSDAIQTWVQKL
ncbi:hypothetical protein ACFWPK_28925 [Nocardia sp. NPDC058519]|uniref:hypothetical protein n=1 Tax=Nocardia sp. NPDC058519 TaxID=3346535 RepID=UPI00365778BB